MTDLFNNDTGTGNDNSGDYMGQLVGEGKKYATVEEAVKALAHAQTFIETLKSDNAHLKNELQSRITMEEFLERQNSRSNPPVIPSDEPKPVVPSAANVSSAPALSKEEVMQIAIEAMKAETTKATRERNVAEAVSQLEAAFGSDYKSKVAAKAQELGVGTEFLSSLAAQSPKALLELVGATKVPARVENNMFAPPPSNRNAAASPAPNSNTRNKAYYDAIRKNNLNEYLSARVQSQMHKDALALGEAFYK